MSNTGVPRATRPSPRNASQTRLSSRGSIDDTVELLTGFTPRQLESINRLVCARVDHALNQTTPTSPTPLRGFTARRSLTAQRSLHDLISTRRSDRTIGRDRQETFSGDATTDSNEPTANSSQLYQGEPSSTHGANFQRNQTLSSMPSSATLMEHPNINDHPALRDQDHHHGHTVSGLSIHDFQPDDTTSGSPTPRIRTTQLMVPGPGPQHRNLSPRLPQDHEVRYLATHPQLLPNTPLTHPHIVDLATVDELIPQIGLGVADVVVTVLYRYDTIVLNKFLNLSKKTFIFRRQPQTASKKGHFIERESKFVTVGICSHDGKNVEESVTYRIIDGATGAWSPVSIRGSRSQTLRGAKAIDDYVRREFTMAILGQKVWEKGQGAKFVVKCK